MSRPDQSLADIDRWIAAAWSDLGVHRARFADSPSGEGADLCEVAEARLNDLLHLRSATSRRLTAA